MAIVVTALVLTKNEEAHIIDCIESLSWCDEIIIVDDDSSDRTLELLERSRIKNKIKVYKRLLEGDFSKQRDFGLTKANGQWILAVDADERVSHELASEIMQVISAQSVFWQQVRAFYIRRIDVMWGKKLFHGEVGNMNLVRLAKKGAGQWRGLVHEKWNIPGEIGHLKNPIFHYPHPTVAGFLSEINYYSSLRAKELFSQKKNAYWWDILMYTKGKFFLNYIGKLGFLDGMQGLIVATMMSFHSFLVRGKLWFLWQHQSRQR